MSVCTALHACMHRTVCTVKFAMWSAVSKLCRLWTDRLRGLLAMLWPVCLSSSEYAAVLCMSTSLPPWKVDNLATSGIRTGDFRSSVCSCPTCFFTGTVLIRSGAQLY